MPVFQRVKPDETTIKALTLTAVELHQMRTAFNRLANQSQTNEEEWARLRAEMVGLVLTAGRWESRGLQKFPGLRFC